MSVQNIHEAIKEIRLSKRLTQVDMAKRLHTTQATYGRIENGQVEITLNRLVQLSEIFNVSVEYILNYPNNENTQGGSQKIAELENKVAQLSKEKQDLEERKDELKQTITLYSRERLQYQRVNMRMANTLGFISRILNIDSELFEKVEKIKLDKKDELSKTYNKVVRDLFNSKTIAEHIEETFTIFNATIPNNKDNTYPEGFEDLLKNRVKK